MMPNTIVANNPPMNPSHVFLGDSCKEQIEDRFKKLINKNVQFYQRPIEQPTLMRGVRPKKKPNM